MDISIIISKLKEYHEKYANASNENEAKYYEQQLEYYDSYLPDVGGGVGNRKYIAIIIPKQVYQILNIPYGTFNINDVFETCGVLQKSSYKMHITILTFEIDPIIKSLVNTSFDLHKSITLTPSPTLLQSLPATESKYVTVNYTDLFDNILNIIYETEQQLVNSVRQILGNKSLVKIQIDKDNNINDAYDINDSYPEIRPELNSSPRYNKSPFNITLKHILFSPAMEFVHKYLCYVDEMWKEVLTVFHYKYKNQMDPNTSTMHISISNDPKDPNKVKNLEHEISNKLSQYNITPNIIHIPNVIVELL